jgi:uncharacterized membrane protein
VNARYFHTLAICAYLGLFGLLMIWQTVLFPSTRFPVALSLLLSVTPLLIPLRGFLNANKKSCSWIAYLSLFYFIHGAIECYANTNESVLAGLEVLLSLLLFFGAAFYVRPPFQRSHD